MYGITNLSWPKHQVWESFNARTRLAHVNNGKTWDHRMHGERSARVEHTVLVLCIKLTSAGKGWHSHLNDSREV